MFLLQGCSSGEKKQASLVKDYDYEWLMGKTIYSIKNIVNMQRQGNFVVFIFNYYDCETCVDCGFHISKKIDLLSDKQMVYPIASMMNPTVYQQRNQYYEYIYTDDRDLIRRELKYIPTPVLILMNDKNTVLDVFFPKDTLNENHQRFIESCLTKNR
jgi:hypothetical protein